MAKNFEPMDDGEEIELEVFTIEFDDGTTAECAVLAIFNVEDEQDYIAVGELDENGNLPAEEMTVLLYRYFEDPNDPNTFSLGDIEDEEERQLVQGIFEQIMDEDDEDDAVYEEDLEELPDDDELMIQSMVDNILKGRKKN